MGTDRKTYTGGVRPRTLPQRDQFGNPLPSGMSGPPADPYGPHSVSSNASAIAAGRDAGRRGTPQTSEQPPSGYAGHKQRLNDAWIQQQGQQQGVAPYFDQNFWNAVFGQGSNMGYNQAMSQSPWYGYGGTPWYGGQGNQYGYSSPGFGVGPSGGDTPMFGYGYGGYGSNIWY